MGVFQASTRRIESCQDIEVCKGNKSVIKDVGKAYDRWRMEEDVQN